MMKWIVFDPTTSNPNYFEAYLVTMEAEAKDGAEAQIQLHRQESMEGWPEDFEGLVGYAKVIAGNAEINREDREDFTKEEWIEKGHSSQQDTICDYKLTTAIEKEAGDGYR